MSLYQFFASEKRMPAFDNLHVISKMENNEVIAICFLPGTSEITAMRIVEEDDLYYASQYTEKKYVNYIEWKYNDKNAEIILEYIKLLLKDRFTVSLYNTWMGDTTPVNTNKIHINSLTISDIKKIWGQSFFTNNECLIVFKNYSD